MLFTAIGSGFWNALFIGGGYALGSRWKDLEMYAQWFDYAIWAFFAIAIGSWVVKKVRKRRQRAAARAR
jgi:membrane protein DedA with SNARE-associated domain